MTLFLTLSKQLSFSISVLLFLSTAVQYRSSSFNKKWQFHQSLKQNQRIANKTIFMNKIIIFSLSIISFIIKDLVPQLDQFYYKNNLVRYTNITSIYYQSYKRRCLPYLQSYCKCQAGKLGWRDLLVFERQKGCRVQ